MLLVDAYPTWPTTDRVRDDTVAAGRRHRSCWAVTNPAGPFLYGSPLVITRHRTAGVATRVVGAFFEAIAAKETSLTDAADVIASSERSGPSSFPATIVVTKCFALGGRRRDQPGGGQYEHDTQPDPGVVFDAQTLLYTCRALAAARPELERVHTSRHSAVVAMHPFWPLALGCPPILP